MTEQQRHIVVRAFPGFEVRRYPDSVVVQVQVDGDVARAARQGTPLLRRYLAGANRTASTFAPAAAVLLAPVPLEPVQCGTAGEPRWVVSVVLPDLLDPARAPAPVEAAVHLSAVPAHEAAVLRFPGGLSGRRATECGRELLLAVRTGGLEPVGAVTFARLAPAWRPGFLGRNEARVSVTSA